MAGILKPSTCDDLCYPESVSQEIPSLWMERVQRQYQDQEPKGVSWSGADPTVHVYEIASIICVGEKRAALKRVATPRRSRPLGSRDESGRTFFDNVRDAVETEMFEDCEMPPVGAPKLRMNQGGPMKPERKPSLDLANDCMAEFESLWEDASSSYHDDDNPVEIISLSPPQPQRLQKSTLPPTKPSRRTSGGSLRGDRTGGCEHIEPPAVNTTHLQSRKGIFKRTTTTTSQPPEPRVCETEVSETESSDSEDVPSTRTNTPKEGANRRRFRWFKSKKSSPDAPSPPPESHPLQQACQPQMMESARFEI